MITNGFTYIAFLVFFAAMLVAIRKTTKWKIFDYVPPIVMVYVFNMIFCTFNLWDMAATAPAYSSIKNNLLYAMIFIMLLRCDFRKLAKLGGRMTAIFVGGAISMVVGTIIAFAIFKGTLGAESWRAMAALCASWVGGSANMAAMQDALMVPEVDFGAVLIVDTIYYSVWIAFLLIIIPLADKWNKAMKADTSKLDAVAAAANEELSAKKDPIDFASLFTLLGISLMVSALCQRFGGIFAIGIIDKGTSTVLLVTIVGLIAALSPLGKISGVEEMSNIYLYVVISLLASRAGLADLLAAPMWLLVGLVILIVHILITVVLSKIFRWDLCMVSTSSLANLGGPASAPIVASAYNSSYAGIGVLMGVLGAALGNIAALIAAAIMQMIA